MRNLVEEISLAVGGPHSTSVFTAEEVIELADDVSSGRVFNKFKLGQKVWAMSDGYPTEFPVVRLSIDAEYGFEEDDRVNITYYVGKTMASPTIVSVEEDYEEEFLFASKRELLNSLKQEESSDTAVPVIFMTYREIFDRANDEALLTLGINLYYINEGGDADKSIPMTFEKARVLGVREHEFKARAK